MTINDILVDSLLLVLLVVILYKAKIFSFFDINENKLSIESCGSYKAIASIIVVFHHLFLMCNDGFVFKKMLFWGEYAVAVFFLISGYGLIQKYKKTNSYGLKDLLKRLSKIMIPYLVANIIYWIFRFAIGNVITIKDYMDSFRTGDMIVPNSWFIVEICILYVVFYIMAKLFRNKYILYVIAGFTLCMFNAKLLIHLGYGSQWYVSTFAFFIGIFVSAYENNILIVEKKIYYILLILSITMFYLFATDYFYKITNNWEIYIHFPYMKVVSFVIMALLIVSKIKIGNNILDFINNISLEIYFYHPLIMAVLRNSHIYVRNDHLFCVLTIFGTILFSCLYKKIVDKYVFRKL